MKLHKPGADTLTVEVQNISSFGLWLLIGEKEYFLSYEDFPWFKDGTIMQIMNVKVIHSGHLHWPDLEVDLTIDSIENTEKYPLTYK